MPSASPVPAVVVSVVLAPLDGGCACPEASAEQGLAHEEVERRRRYRGVERQIPADRRA